MAIKTILAQTKEELEMGALVRFKVFADDEGSLIPSDFPSGREIDGFDIHQTSAMIIALDADEPVGTVRVLLENREIADRNGWDYGLDIETMYSLRPYKDREIAIAEVPRTCVIKSHRRGPVLMELYKKVYQFCRDADVTHVCGSVSTYSDNIKDAEIIYYLIRKKGMLGDIELPRKESHIKSEGIKIDQYPDLDDSSPDTIEKYLKRGDELRLPGIVRVLSNLGVKIVGQPEYYRKFDRYILPMSLELSSIPEPAKSYFESKS
ncbi:GNAT family N-acetyltransferase [Candidatus Woesearchaeota archaeon]|nr:GNAT family N-acetyltransferase [Candidatus Woesearchaeota archaeon]